MFLKRFCLSSHFFPESHQFPCQTPCCLPPCPESQSSFRAEVHVGDSGARFAGCGGDRRLRLQLRGHGAVPKVEAALPSCQWPSRGALFPGRADGSCPQRSASCLACGRALPRGPAAPLRLVPKGQRPCAWARQLSPASLVEVREQPAQSVGRRRDGAASAGVATQDRGRRRVTVTLCHLMGFASAELCGRPTGGLYISLLRGESCSPPDAYVKPPAPQNANLSGPGPCRQN